MTLEGDILGLAQIKGAFYAITTRAIYRLVDHPVFGESAFQKVLSIDPAGLPAWESVHCLLGYGEEVRA